MKRFHKFKKFFSSVHSTRPHSKAVFETLINIQSSPSVRGSPFFDSAHEHTFSDWLFAVAFDCGQDLNDLVPGALPDISDIVNVSEAGRSIIPLFWKKKKMLRFGKLLKKNLSGKILIDCGAGDSAISIIPLALAQWSGAAGYWAFDSFHRKEFLYREGVGGFVDGQGPLDLQDFESISTEAIKGLPKIFLLSGIELKDSDSLVSQNIVQKMMRKIQDFCRAGDGILLCVSSRDCQVVDSRFAKVYEDAYIEFFICRDENV